MWNYLNVTDDLYFSNKPLHIRTSAFHWIKQLEELRWHCGNINAIKYWLASQLTLLVNVINITSDSYCHINVICTPFIKCYILNEQEKANILTKPLQTQTRQHFGTRCESKKTHLQRPFENPVNQTEHEKNQKNQDVIWKRVSGQKSSQFISRLVTGTEKKKKHLQRSGGIRTQRTWEQKYLCGNQCKNFCTVAEPFGAGTSMQMFSAPLYCMHFWTQLNQGASVCRLIFMNASIKTIKDITNTHALHSYKNSPTTHFPLCFRWRKKVQQKRNQLCPHLFIFPQNKGIN